MSDPRPTPPPSVGCGEFYVGYLPMPPTLAFYVRVTIPLLLWLAIGAAVIVSRSQSNPGDGTWNTGEVVTLEGLIDARPYPLLRVPGSRLGQPFESVLLVETGKQGARRAASWDGQFVQTRGWIVQRDERRMLELIPGEDALKGIHDPDPAVAAALRRVAMEDLGEKSLHGEIVDAKCFLGVMKPGHGKTHKECAMLCIRGGIPPFFIARGADGAPRYYLLSNSEGTGFDSAFLPLVADPVDIRGRVERRGDLMILHVRPTDLRRADSVFPSSHSRLSSR